MPDYYKQPNETIDQYNQRVSGSTSGVNLAIYKPIGVSELSSPPQPLNVPPAPPPIAPDSNITNFTSSVDQYLGDNSPEANAVTQSSNDYQSLAARLLNKGTDTAAAYQQSGYNDYSAQLKNLDPQLTALQNQYKDLSNLNDNVLPAQEQLKELGGNIEAAQSGRQNLKEQLLQNSIKMGGVASQFLALQSQAAILQGKVSIAKDMADRAVEAQYKPIEDALTHTLQIYNMNKDALQRADSRRTALLGFVLNERSRLLDQAKADKSTILGWAAAAVKNFPNNPAAQYAAQQAAKTDNLDEAFKLLSPYQSDPIAQQKALDDHKLAQAQYDKIYADINAALQKNTATTVTDPKTGKPINQLVLDARESAQQLLTKFMSGQGTSAVGKSGFLNSFGYGLIPGTQNRDFKVQFNNLKSLLQLEDVKYLKGQGQVSDAERRLLSEASGKLELSQSEAEFQSSLETITRVLGGDSSGSTLLTGPDGKQYNVPNDQVDQFIKDGGHY